MTYEYTIVLTRSDVLRAVAAGAQRKAMHQYAAFLGEKRPDNNGQRGGPDHDPWDEVISSCAEYAVAAAIHRFWPGDVFSKQKTIDIPPDIEVRWTKYEDGHLFLYNEDKPEYKYVLVTGNIPTFNIHGWIEGKEGKNPAYWGRFREDRAPCFKVRQDLLKPIEDLICRGTLSPATPSV